MKIKNQTGFTVIEGVIVVFVCSVLAGACWYIWHVRQNTDNTHTESVTQTQQTSQSANASYTLDSVKGVINYHNKLGKFSLSYPSSWVHIDTTDKLCGGVLDRDLEIGPNQNSLAKCASDGAVSQVSVQSVNGDQTHNDNYLFVTAKKGWIHQITSSVTADGVKGTFYCATAKGQGQGVGAYPDGAYVYENVFLKNNITYIATYTEYPKSSPSGPNTDQDAAFNKIIGNLKFN